MSKYKVDSSSLTAVANAIRTKTGESESLSFPTGFVSAINGISGGGTDVSATTATAKDVKAGKVFYAADGTQTTGTNVEPFYTDIVNWTRPQGWPDLDALLTADTDTGTVVYYTVDNTDGCGWLAVGLTITGTHTTYLERGHVENATFIVDDTLTVTNHHRMIYAPFDGNSWGDYPVFRLRYSGGTVTAITGNGNVIINSITAAQRNAPVLEVVCRLSGTVEISHSLSFYSMQRLKIIGGKIKSLLLSDCKELRKINAEDWDTSEITDMKSLFSACSYLQEIRCENWDVQKVTTFYGTFDYCRRLIKLDLSKWKNSIATTYAFFARDCSSLEEITFNNNIKTTNVTTIQSMFQRCFKLKKIDVSFMNTSAMTSMQDVFNNCVSLYEITGASHLDTSHIT